MYTEEQPGDAAIMLFIKDLREEDSGTYRCRGIYATNEEMHAQVDISTFSKFNLLKILLILYLGTAANCSVINFSFFETIPKK